MRSRLFVVAIVALLASSTAFATTVTEGMVGNTRVEQAEQPNETLGTLGSFSTTLEHINPLQGRVEVGCTTTGGTAFAPSDAVLLYGQIYDYPWAGGTTGQGGTNTTVQGATEIIYAIGANGVFEDGWSFTVQVPNLYQGFGLILGGYYVDPTFFYTYRWSTYPGPTEYIDSTDPTPGGGGGEPIPTLSWVGMLMLAVLLAGAGIVVMMRR